MPSTISLNCRSVCNKRNELSQLLDDSKADVVVLTETWVTRANEQLIINDIKRHNTDYEVISARRSREGIERGGGVMILVNKGFSTNTTVISTTTTEDDTSELLEALVIQTHQPALVIQGDQESSRHVSSRAPTSLLSQTATAGRRSSHSSDSSARPSYRQAQD